MGNRQGDASPIAARTVFFPSVPQMLGQYPFGLSFSQSKTEEEEIIPTFQGYATGAYYGSSPVFACILARASLFSEARFQWRQFRNGRPGPLFGTADLAPLEQPWPNGTTGDLIVRLEQDYSLSGNFYGRRSQGGIQRMRPDWVTIVLGSNMLVEDPAAALDAEILGYIYHPGGRTSGHEPVPLLVNEVCHFTGPTPDPTARFRGTSWLTSILSEIQSDNSATTAKQKYFDSGGPNIAISVDIPDPQEFNDWVASFKERSEGAANSYSRLFFNTGVPTTSVIGSTMTEMDFKAVQGAGETRIASVAGVPPIVVGFSEGLDAATYSNYALAMRRFADLTARPMWRMMSACFQSVLTVPPGAELWYDDRDIPALKDDITQIAEKQTKTAAAAKLYFDAGYEPNSIIDALDSDDLTRLNHTGVTSVQNQGAVSNGQTQMNGNQQMQLPSPRADLMEVLDDLEEVIQR